MMFVLLVGTILLHSANADENPYIIYAGNETNATDFCKVVLNGSTEEIMSLNPVDLTEHLPHLQHFGLPVYKKQMVFELYKKLKPPDEMNITDLELLGHIVSGMADGDLSAIKFQDKEILTFFGDLEILSRRQYGIIATILQKLYSTPTMMNVSFMNCCRGIICGYSPTMLEAITPLDLLQLTEEVFDKIYGCSERQCLMLLKVAIQVTGYGDPKIWDEYTVRRLGLLVCYLTPEAFSSIVPESIAGLKKKTLIHMGHKMEWLTSDQVEYLNKEALAVYRRTVKFHIRVPKCCEDGSVLIKTCEKAENVPFHIDVPVLENNETHLDNQPLESSLYQLQTYHHFPNCKKIILDQEYDFYSLLTNGSLIVGGDFGKIFPPQDFCVDNMLLDGNYNSTVVVCYNADIGVVYYLLLSLAILSMLSLIATDVIFIFTDDKVYGIHKGCMIAYCTAMAVTFLSLVIVLSVNGATASCKALGVFFQLAYISSQTFLAILCYDMAFIIYYYKYQTYDGRRKVVYVIVALLLPALSLFSLIQNGNPAVPNSFIKSEFNPNLCAFDDKERSRSFFYIPVGIASCFGIASLIAATFLYRRFRNSNERDPYWIEKESRYKNMLKQSAMCTAISSLCLLAHFASFVIDSYSGLAIAGNVTESFQGIFLFMIFVIYKFQDVSKMSRSVKKKVYRRKQLRRQNAEDRNGSSEGQELNQVVSRNDVAETGDTQMMRNGSVEIEVERIRS